MTEILVQGPFPEGEGNGLLPSPLVALDPGGTTGIAVCRTGTHTTDEERDDAYSLRDLDIKSAQIGPHPHHRELYTILKELSPRTIICESFQYRQWNSQSKDDQFNKMSKSKVELTSVEYIGIVKYFTQIFDTILVWQTPSEAKGFVSNDKLKNLGWYIPGKPHSNDAKRHLTYYMVNSLKLRHPVTTMWREKSQVA